MSRCFHDASWRERNIFTAPLCVCVQEFEEGGDSGDEDSQGKGIETQEGGKYKQLYAQMAKEMQKFEPVKARGGFLEMVLQTPNTGREQAVLRGMDLKYGCDWMGPSLSVAGPSFVARIVSVREREQEEKRDRESMYLCVCVFYSCACVHLLRRASGQFFSSWGTLHRNPSSTHL